MKPESIHVHLVHLVGDGAGSESSQKNNLEEWTSLNCKAQSTDTGQWGFVEESDQWQADSAIWAYSDDVEEPGSANGGNSSLTWDIWQGFNRYVHALPAA
ncbi:hypothetical protein MD484_g372, partial [Candolleomyces efflorescens]